MGTQHQLCHLAGLHYHDLAEDHVNGRLLDHEAPPFLAVPASSRRSGLTGVMPKKGPPGPRCAAFSYEGWCGSGGRPLRYLEAALRAASVFNILPDRVT